MNDEQPRPTVRSQWRLAERIYAACLFTIAVAVLSIASAASDGLPGADQPVAVLFFLLYGLFTISIGYQHPKVGYYSFDRVAQVASILVLGPIAAAWVNGLASLIYPWHRIWKGVPAQDVLFAALNNAGLMAIIVLAAGTLYAVLGGDVPLTELSARNVALLVGLLLVIQALNDIGMLGTLLVGRRDIGSFFQPFFVALEIGSGATAVLVALVFNTMPNTVLILLLGVLSLGMLALRQLASMRHELERIVLERTRRLREKTRELELQATQDNLTGLYNRRFADAYLDRQLPLLEHGKRSFSIALADIDLFKQINDSHSHAIGDTVLRTVADTLRLRCRKTDMIARYGGEEFLICFPDTDQAGAERLCEALRESIELRDWMTLGLRGSVTLSFGVAEHRPGLSADSLVHKADLRLYAAKEGGRNLVVG